jgi:hypothetical protein
MVDFRRNFKNNMPSVIAGGIFICIFFLTQNGYAEVHPFSTVTITSNRASFEKDKNNKDMFVIRYDENVHVTFADDSKVHAQHLEIRATNKSDKKNPVEKIYLTDSVSLTKNNKTINAENAEINVDSTLCTFKKNVSIEQKKEKDVDIPIHTKSDCATFNWETEEITLAGNKQDPVHTIIELKGNPRILKKFDSNKKKRHGKHK